MSSGIYTGTLGVISNRAHWSEMFDLVDTETGDVIIPAAGDEVTVYVTRVEAPDVAVLSGSIADGTVAISQTGSGTWTFGPAAMARLCAGTYSVFVRATIGGVVYQLLAADIPVIDGGPA